MTEYIDWQALNRRQEEDRQRQIQEAINELKQSVALLADLERNASWQHLCILLKNTATSKQNEAMKATDPTSMARAFGYMAACLDTINLPTTMAQQLQAQLASLAQP